MGVGSFFALNKAFLYKWMWRFRTNQTSLWARVVKEIDEENALSNCDTLLHRRSVWIDIIQAILDLCVKGIIFFDSCKKLNWMIILVFGWMYGWEKFLLKTVFHVCFY